MDKIISRPTYVDCIYQLLQQKAIFLFYNELVFLSYDACWILLTWKFRLRRFNGTITHTKL